MNDIKRVLQKFMLASLVLVVLSPSLVHAKSSKKIYNESLKKWTRWQETYQREDFYSSLRWEVTLQSPEFVAAKVRRMASIYDYSEAKFTTVKAAEEEKFGDVIGFYVSFYAYDYRFSDLFDKRNGWKVKMHHAGQEYTPLKNEHIVKLTPLYQVLYPYSDVWSHHYYVYFKKPEGFDWQSVKLGVYGPGGKSILSWQKAN